MPLLLIVAFLVVPIVELAVIIQVGQVIGLGWTIVALVVVSVVGAWLVRREGTRAWRKLREAIAEPRLPTVEVTDGALVVLGGALMLTPGFVTDVVGLLLVVPATRAVVSRMVRHRVRVMTLGGPIGGPVRRDRRPRGPRPAPLRRDHDESVVEVEVISIERDDAREDGGTREH